MFWNLLDAILSLVSKELNALYNKTCFETCLMWCHNITSSSKMLQVSKHVFDSKLNYCFLVMVTVLNIIKCKGHSINIQITRCEQWQLWHNLLRSSFSSPKQLWKDGTWKYTSSFSCMNTHLWIELMPAKHTISFILVDCKQPVGSL